MVASPSAAQASAVDRAEDKVAIVMAVESIPLYGQEGALVKHGDASDGDAKSNEE